MPWTKKDYPPAMNNLPVRVRNKAVEIANAILHEGKLEEGAVIATAISKAKEAKMVRIGKKKRIRRINPKRNVIKSKIFILN